MSEVEGVVSLERFNNVLALLPLTRDWAARFVLRDLADNLAEKLSISSKQVTLAYIQGPAMVRLRVVGSRIVGDEQCCSAMVRVNEDIAYRWLNDCLSMEDMNVAIDASRNLEGDPRHCSLCRERNNLKE